MTEEEVIGRIEPLFRDLFDAYAGPVTRALAAKDVDQWDSLANVQLMVMVEMAFGIRFATREVVDLQDLGELVDLVALKVG